MPRFEPFAGLRYDTERVPAADVTAPPYDVIDDHDRAGLCARSPFNIVCLDLPVGGDDRYEHAGSMLRQWQDGGILVADEEPAFYVYRMGFHDAAGRARQTAGVIGAMELATPDQGEVLPHERTTPRARSDRLELLRATRANLSPIWGLSLAPGLSGLCELPGGPLMRFTDPDGVHHRLYRIAEPAVIEAIADTVGSAPVVIADGHHRYATSLQYRDERRDAAGGASGPYDATMTFVVELTDTQLDVQPIHRLVDDIPGDVDVVALWEPYFETFAGGPASASALEALPDRMADAGALALLLDGAIWLLRPRSEAFEGVDDLDSARLDLALAALPTHTVRYQHGFGRVAAEVSAGRARAGVFLRPASVETIARMAHERRLMPPKTTFFAPKPCTGLVLRPLD